MIPSLIMPLLVVFGVDYTLWPFWANTQYTSPYNKTSTGKIIDSHGNPVLLYEDVPKIMETLQKSNIKIALAARKGDFKAIKELLRVSGWRRYISYRVLQKGGIRTHFKILNERTNISFTDMMFFDDSYRNIRDASSLGVHGVLIQMGMNINIFEESMQQFRDSKLKAMTEIKKKSFESASAVSKDAIQSQANSA